MGFGLVITLLFCCVVVVPPWRLAVLWADIDATERTGLMWMLCLALTGMVGIAYRIAYREGRHR